MPTMANITVKAANGTTDVVYSQINPSSGDKSAAFWRAEALGTAANLRPTLEAVSQWNGPRTARRLTMRYMWPYIFTNASTFEKTVKARVPIEVSVTVPTEVVDTDLDEVVAQFSNLLSSALIRSCMKTGFAPS